VGSIAQQVDHLFVHLDKFDRIPEELAAWPNVTARLSKDFGQEMRDNAKFLPFNSLKNSHERFYFLTCDDDLIYPLDYVRTHLSRLAEFDNGIIAGLHGVICAERPASYFEERFVFHFTRGLSCGPQLVNNLGTGTVSFHSDLFEALSPKSWGKGGMVDILLSVEAQKRDIPMVCIERHDGWVRQAPLPDVNNTLYAEGRLDEGRLVAELTRAGTWGYSAIRKTIEAQPAYLREKLYSLLPRFADSSLVAAAHRRLRG
jgi:hypothetical protein